MVQRLLPNAKSEAKSLQLLHRLGRLIGKRVKRVCAKANLGDRNVTALKCEPPEPSRRSALVAIGIAVSQHHADAHASENARAITTAGQELVVLWRRGRGCFTSTAAVLTSTPS